MAGPVQIWILLHCLIWSSNSFNVDVKFPLLLNGTPGSYFGYAVQFWSNQAGIWALVTAPQGNTTVFPNSIHEPGVIYACSIQTNRCEEIAIDRSDNGQRPADASYYTQDFSRNWLGVSLAVQKTPPKRILVCGHRWKQRDEVSTVFSNGICYVMDEDLHPNSVRKIWPLINTSKQTRRYTNQKGSYFYYGLGMAGMSSAFSEDGKELLLGAPTFDRWIGSVIHYKTEKKLRQGEEGSVLDVFRSADGDSYVGYAITSGRFFFGSETTYALGAPKDKGYFGKVYIIRLIVRENSKVEAGIIDFQEGKAMGSYFGASLTSANLTRGSYSSLLVGAPMHSTDNGGDEGRIYVYLFDGNRIREQDVLIVGSLKPGARFGSSVAELGDINQDDFHDIAVGAPYEDDGHGALYIYHGGPQGLQCSSKPKPCKPAQVIYSSKLPTSIRGFGCSISSTMDIDNNMVLDLLVGSYESDQAVILRSHPIITISVHLYPKVKQVDRSAFLGIENSCRENTKSVLCFTITACVDANGRHANDSNFHVELELDPFDISTVRQRRVYFFENNLYKSQIKDVVTAIPNKEECRSYKIHVAEDISNSLDYVTPIIIRLNATQEPRPETTFCGTCPVLDPNSQTSMSIQIPFLTGCGEGKVCQPDLLLIAHVDNLSSGATLVSGLNRNISLRVRVRNRQEPAYRARLTVTLPDGIGVINQANCHIRKGALGEVARNAISLECDLGNPLERKHTAKEFQILLDITKLPFGIKKTSIELKASSDGNETFPDDNSRTIELYFEHEAHLRITGEAEKFRRFYVGNEIRVPVNHRYNLEKTGPSPVDLVVVQIKVPVRDKIKGINFITIKNVEIAKQGGNTGSLGTCNLTSTLDEPGDSSQYVSQKVRSGDGDFLPGGGRSDVPLTPIEVEPNEFHPTAGRTNMETFYELNCKTAECETVVCTLGPFLNDKQRATIEITADMNISALEQIGHAAMNVTVVGEGNAGAQDEEKFPSTDDETQVYIQLVRISPPEEIKVPNWIVAVSVGGAALLLGLIILGLVQLGFFHRKKHEEVQRLMKGGQVVSSSVENEEPTEEDDDNTEFPDMDEFPYIESLRDVEGD